MVKAIFLDIDGTLRDERNGVPESARRAICLCRKKGIRILICTGRNLASIQEDVRSIETDGIIAGGGCLTMENGRVQKQSYFQNAETKFILDFALLEDLPFAMESQEQIFMNGTAAALLRTDFARKLERLGIAKQRQRQKENGIRYLENINEYRPGRDRIHKFCLWCRPGDYDRACFMAADRGAIAQQSGRPDGKSAKWGYLELQPPGCTKGAAIRRWCAKNGIKTEETMSFGDGKNDVDMIRTTGIGVAMADADEELKIWADSQCGTAPEDGIYRELVRRGIIG